MNDPLEKLLRTLRFVPYDGRDLQPGDVLRETDGNIHLVGHINNLFGVCDDCKLGKQDIDGIANIMDILSEWRSIAGIIGASQK